MKIEKGTIIRTVLLVIALINQFLTIAGRPVLPFTDEMVNELVSWGFTAVTAAVAWWKNNSYTQAALKGDVAMKAEREKNA